MRKIKAVIFDMDGLLVDSEPIQFEASRALFRHYHHRFTLKHLKEFLGVRLTEELGTLKKRWELLPSVEELKTERKKIFSQLVKKKIQLAKGAKELLLFLRHAQIPIGLGTSAEPWYINLIINKFNLNSYFDVVIGANQVKNGKPDPGVYLTVAQALKIPPSQCVVLEDAVNGVAAARAAGMMCFAVPNPYIARREFTDAQQIFNSLAQVLTHFKKLQKAQR